MFYFSTSYPRGKLVLFCLSKPLHECAVVFVIKIIKTKEKDHEVQEQAHKRIFSYVNATVRLAPDLARFG